MPLTETKYDCPHRRTNGKTCRLFEVSYPTDRTLGWHCIDGCGSIYDFWNWDSSARTATYSSVCTVKTRASWVSSVLPSTTRSARRTATVPSSVRRTRNCRSYKHTTTLEHAALALLRFLNCRRQKMV
jgi:hypothetical protein